MFPMWSLWILAGVVVVDIGVRLALAYRVQHHPQ